MKGFAGTYEGGLILFVCAVTQESAALRKYMTTVERQKVAQEHGWGLWRGIVAGCPILLLQTGMGKESARAAVQSVLQAYPVTRMLNFGFGAAAREGLAVGDRVVGTSFLSTDRPTGAAQDYPADADLVLAAQVAGSGGPSLHSGACLTVDAVVSQPQEKRRLGQAYAVHTIDMESYPLAQAAARQQIPFVALRVISDDVDEALPALDSWVRPDGTVNWPAALRRWGAHPGDLWGLLRMARHGRCAQRSLATWLPEMIARSGS